MTQTKQDLTDYYATKFKPGLKIEFQYEGKWYPGSIEGIAMEHIFTYYIVRIDKTAPLSSDFDVYPYDHISISNNFIREVN